MRNEKGQFVKGHIPWHKGKHVKQFTKENNPFFNKKHTKEIKKIMAMRTKERIKKGGFGFQKGHKINVGRPSPKKDKKFPERSGKNHHNWHGGKVIHKSGYVQVYSPNHPNKSMRCYVPEHRLVMEKKLGRYLKPTEIVHHRNGNRYDNRPENLILTVKNKNWHLKTCPNCNFKFEVI